MSEFYSTACECVKYRWKDHSRCFDCETGNTGYFASFKTITTTLHGMTFNSVALETVVRTLTVTSYPQLLKSWTNYAYTT